MPGGMGGEGGMVDMGPQTDVSGVAIAGPVGPGWVVELAGYHFYNDGPRTEIGSAHVEKTLLKQLKEGFVDVPLGPKQKSMVFKMEDLGIGYAILAYNGLPRKSPIQITFSPRPQRDPLREG